MANKKINELIELLAPADDDLMIVYDLSESGQEKTKRININNFLSNVSGTLQNQIDSISIDKLERDGSEFKIDYTINIGEWLKFSLDGVPTFGLVYKENCFVLENLLTTKGLKLLGTSANGTKLPILLGSPEGATTIYHNYNNVTTGAVAAGYFGLDINYGTDRRALITWVGSDVVFRNLGGTGVYLKGSGDTNILYGAENAGVRLYYAAAEKIRTTTNGVLVTGILDATSNITINNAPVATQTYVNNVSGTLDSKISEKLNISGGNITGNVSIAGNLSVNGTTFTVNTETVTVEDNLILVNANETGAGVTAGVAGIEVERGTETNYHFLFDEYHDNFRVGISGALQAVATRQDTPAASGIAYWNSTLFRMDTTSNLTYSANILSAPYIKATGSNKTSGTLYAGSTDPTDSIRLNYDGYFYATRVYNAYLNDIADFQKVADEKIPGKCYYDTLDGAKICTQRCQKSTIGILSDTFGIGAGANKDQTYAPFAVAGWVLAYIDIEAGEFIEPGDVLTSNFTGNLVKMSEEEKRNFPERIVAIYKKPETAEFWGPNNEIKVNGRHWVKVR